MINPILHNDRPLHSGLFVSFLVFLTQASGIQFSIHYNGDIRSSFIAIAASPDPSCRQYTHNRHRIRPHPIYGLPVFKIREWLQGKKLKKNCHSKE